MVRKSPLYLWEDSSVVLTPGRAVHYRIFSLVDWRSRRGRRPRYQHSDWSGSTHWDRCRISNLFLRGHIGDRPHALAISRQLVCVYGHYSDESSCGKDCVYLPTNSC